MRPIKLTICGINSYVTQQVVDFKKLSEGNLFGIFGATGSGKSTILDSIIIALYGTSDRDNLSNLININVKDAYIKFEFELERDGKINSYEVVRNYRLRPSGLTSGAYLTDKNTKEVLGDSTDIVNSQLEMLLGISKKEFLKCIALPQNEFDKFLLDTPSERKKSIARLFNIENFGELLNKKVKSRLDVLTTKDEELEKQLNMFNEITDESQKQLEHDIRTDERESVKLTRLIEKLSNEVKDADEFIVKLKSFNDAKTVLSDINSKVEYYDKLSEDLDKYAKNKESLANVELLNKQTAELDKVKTKLKTCNIELSADKIKYANLDRKYIDIKSERELQNVNLNVFKLSIEKKKVMTEELAKLEVELKEYKEKHSKKLDELLILTEHIKKVEGNTNRTNKDIEKVKNELKDIEEILKQLTEIRVYNESKEFAKGLKDIKSSIDKDSLDEVKYYQIYNNVHELLIKINKLLSDCNSKIKKRKLILEDLKIEEDGIDDLYKRMIKRQNTLINELNVLNKKYTDNCALLSRYNGDAANLQSEIDHIKNDLLAKTETATNFNSQLKQLANITDTTDVINQLDSQLQEIENEKFDVNNAINNNTSNVKALEVEIKYMEEKVEELKQLIPEGFNASEYSSDVTEDNFDEKKKELEEFTRLKEYNQTLYDSLENELKDKNVTLEDIETKREQVEQYRTQLNDVNVRLGINKNIQENNINLLNKQNDVKNELRAVKADLKLTQKLNQYISKNALVDYVSEEYLYLISQYANRFVYSISRGKYMLKYSSDNSGEFLAIDNFNGGMTRSIKTLSGGERFIFSLSLALGVSQSISINNNKSFNFFFIDEGFGNLSDDYINDVLECFDSLIKLDFTVGFITHVEKMQEYITNKVIVTKENNEIGSVIEQY
ncbi:MAG TPA: hypothetical protein DD621_01655 [Clostridiales bacterium]|nr:hypothetical protein [Clostridiales bacterium]